MTTTKQHISFIRYGLTEFPLVEYDGPYNSDIHPKEGVDHGYKISERFQKLTPESIPSEIYASPFLRSTHTGAILSEALSVPLNIEHGLYEWLTPSLLVDRSGVMTYPQTVQELKEKFPSAINESYESVNPVDPDGPFEDVDTLLLRCETTITKILDNVEDYKNLCVVSHAPCLQAMVFALLKESLDASSSSLYDEAAKVMGEWPLGGVTTFSREISTDDSKTDGKWTLECYGATEHMPGEYSNGLGPWSLPLFTVSK